VFGDGVRSAVVHRAGAGRDAQPAFEISRRTPNALAYLLSFNGRTGGLTLNGDREAVVAEIEIESRPGAEISIDVDPALTLLGSSDGTGEATVGAGTLRVSGTVIEPQTPARPRKNVE